MEEITRRAHRSRHSIRPCHYHFVGCIRNQTFKDPSLLSHFFSSHWYSNPSLLLPSPSSVTLIYTTRPLARCYVQAPLGFVSSRLPTLPTCAPLHLVKMMPTQPTIPPSPSHRAAPPAPPRLVSISLSSGIGDGGAKTEEAWIEQTKYEGGKSLGDTSTLQIEGPDAAAAAGAAGRPRPRWLSLLLLGLGITITLSVVGALIASFHNEILDGEEEGEGEWEGRRFT